MAGLKLKNIYKRYSGGVTAVSDFSLDIADKEFIICTEDGVEAKLAADHPGKKFYFPQNRPCCIDMKRNTLEKLLHVLRTEDNEVTENEELRESAIIPLERMLELGR